MDTGFVSAVVGAGASIVGGVVWLVRLEGRVNAHDGRHRDHEKRHDEIRSDLTYIRERIDRALNGKHG